MQCNMSDFYVLDVLNITSQVHNSEVPLINTGIAWPSDKDRKFQNPPAPSGLEAGKCIEVASTCNKNDKIAKFT
jgi:hypothetical protein